MIPLGSSVKWKMKNPSALEKYPTAMIAIQVALGSRRHKMKNARANTVLSIGFAKAKMFSDMRYPDPLTRSLGDNS